VYYTYRVFVCTPFQVTFNRPEKLGSYSCTAANNLGKITRRFNLIEGFKPKTPSGLSAVRVGDSYIELQVLPNDKEDELIGYRVEYVMRVVEPGGNTFKSFDMMNFNTTEGTCNRTTHLPPTVITAYIIQLQQYLLYMYNTYIPSRKKVVV